MPRGNRQPGWMAMLIACAVLAAPSDASARRNWGREQVSFEEAITRDFIVCFVGRRRDGVQRWLASLPGSREERSVYRRLVLDFPPCWGRGYNAPAMDITPGELRWRFAAELLKRRYEVLPAISPLSATSVAWFERALTALPSDAPVDRPALIEQNLAFCLSQTHWPEIIRFYATVPLSTGDNEAFRALAPYVAGCVPAGVEMEVDTGGFRRALAEALYHILIEGQQPPRE